MTIHVKDLTLDVTTDNGTKRILHGVSFDAAKGEALGFVGESGSGKSMTLKCILGIEPPGSKVAGCIEVNDVDVRTLSGTSLREFRAMRVAMIAQNPHGTLNPVLPVRRYLAEGLVDAQGRSRADASRISHELLRAVGIQEIDRVLDSYPHQLSGGMLQRVVIAGAVAGEPDLLLADEPTTALDVTTQAEVAAILTELRLARNMSLIFVTHDLDLAAAICDRLIVMQHGRIVETGTPSALRDNPKHPYTRALMDARPQLHRKR